MILEKRSFFITAAHRLDFQCPMRTNRPSFYDIRTDTRFGGCSYGYNRAALQSSAGEFIERAHFWRPIPSDLSGSIKDLCSKDTTASIFKCMRQIVGERLATQALERRLHLTRVLNLFDGKEEHVPSAMLSLASHPDQNYFPLRDTTGNAIHTRGITSIEKSFLEFLERQFIISSWVFKTFRTVFAIDTYEVFGHYSKFIADASKIGKIYISDISTVEGVYCCMLGFSARDDSFPVQFSIGCGCDFTMSGALQKALPEFYGGFLTMASIYEDGEARDLEAEEEWMDRYTVRFVRANSPTTASGFGPFSDHVEPLMQAADIRELKAGSFEEACDNVRKISANVFLFLSGEQILDRVFAVSKVFSPDFFATMDFSNPVNHDNEYVRYLGEEPVTGEVTDVPFP